MKHPEKLGPFRIIRVVGRGGMGAVYEAVNEESKETVALKVLMATLEEDQESRNRFEAEIETLKRLRHPNIVRLFGFGQDEDMLYYAMEFVDGPSLATLLKKGHIFSWEETIHIGVEVCKALRHAHVRGIIHRDIKPANILMLSDGQVKVSDYGIAHFFGDSRMTTANMVIGTIEFMSPEQAQAGPLTPKSDIYSLGALLYALLTGHPPYQARTLAEILQRYRQGSPESIRYVRPEVPTVLDVFILELLRIQSENRPKDIHIIGRRLEAIQMAFSGQSSEKAFRNTFASSLSLGEEFFSATNDQPPLVDKPTEGAKLFDFQSQQDQTARQQSDFTPSETLANNLPYKEKDAGFTLDVDGIDSPSANKECFAVTAPLDSSPISDIDDENVVSAHTGPSNPPTRWLTPQGIPKVTDDPEVPLAPEQSEFKQQEPGNYFSETPDSSVWSNRSDPLSEQPTKWTNALQRNQGYSPEEHDYPSEKIFPTGELAAPKTSHFTFVEEDDLGNLEMESEQPKYVSLKIWIFSIIMLLVGILVWFSLRPPSADSLFNRIETKIAHLNDLEDVGALRFSEKDMRAFISLYPNDHRAEKVFRYLSELELVNLERRIERQIEKKSRDGSLSPVEDAYVQVVQLAKNDPEKGIFFLNAFINLFSTIETFGEETESSEDECKKSKMEKKIMFDRTIHGRCVILAERRLVKIKSDFERKKNAETAVLEGRMEFADSLEANHPQEANIIRQAIIDFYGDKRWASAIVSEAREKHTACVLNQSKVSATRHPNIVFILVDDLGEKDLTATGSTFYETPAIDRICSGGIRFLNAYAACPVCSPTRAAIMTGKYPARLKITNWIDPRGTAHPIRAKLTDAEYLKQLPLEEVTLAETLKNAGYATWHIGKWHLGGPGFYPTEQGFEVNVAGCEQGHPWKGYFSPYGFPTLQDGPDGEYLTDRLTNEAIALIRKNSQADAPKPFFLNLWYYTVHTPLQPKPEKLEYYKAKKTRLELDHLTDEEIFGQEEGSSLLPKTLGRPINYRKVQNDAPYAAMVASLDENVGRIMNVLDELKLRENTIIVFTSDNGGLSTAGGPTSNEPLRAGKSWFFEGGIRVPLFVSYPNQIAAGTVCEKPVTSPDFYPTLLEMAGVSSPKQLIDGVSFADSLSPQVPNDPLKSDVACQGVERDIFWHFPHYHSANTQGPGSAIRSDHWKLIELFDSEEVRLYDLKEDPSEKTDLSTRYPEKVAELREKLAIWRNEVGAAMPRTE